MKDNQNLLILRTFAVGLSHKKIARSPSKQFNRYSSLFTGISRFFFSNYVQTP